MLSSLKLDRNRKVTNVISTIIASKKIKPFATGLEVTISNLATGRVNIRFNNSVLVQESFYSLYSNLFLNYMVYELSNWPPNPTEKVTLKHCLLGTLKLGRNVIKSKFTYNGWGIAFDGEGL